MLDKWISTLMDGDCLPERDLKRLCLMVSVWMRMRSWAAFSGGGVTLCCRYINALSGNSSSRRGSDRFMVHSLASQACKAVSQRLRPFFCCVFSLTCQ